MLEILYILLLIAFGGLIVVAITQYLVRSGGLKDKLENLRLGIDRMDDRLAEMRRQLDNAELDVELLEQEKEALQAREVCLRKLEHFAGSNSPVEKNGKS